MKISDCHNFHDFRKLARQNLPYPIFNYIDGAADDEITYKRNSQAYNDVDLVPNVLAGVEKIDLSTTIFGKKIGIVPYIMPGFSLAKLAAQVAQDNPKAHGRSKSVV